MQGLLNGISDPLIADVGASFRKGEERKKERDFKSTLGEVIKNTPGYQYADLVGIDPEKAVAFADAFGIPKNETDRLKNAAGTIVFANKLLRSPNVDPGAVGTYLFEQANLLGSQGISIDLLMDAAEGLSSNDPNRVKAEIDAFGQLAAELGPEETAQQRNFDSLTEGLSDEDKNKARRIELGLDPRAVGSAVQTIAQNGNVNEVADVTSQLSGADESGSQGVKIAGEMFNKIEPIKRQISNYDEAIAALDSGASTGPVVAMLPSVKEASVQLDNAQKQLGLNVIQNTTFGALSTEEMKLALDTALPKKLEPAALREWLVKKRDAQAKLLAYVESAASFLSDPQNGGLSAFLKDKKKSNWTLMEDANGNRAYVGPNGEVEPI